MLIDRVSEKVVDRLFHLFINRIDTYGIQQDGTYVRVAEPLTKETGKDHLAGKVSVGTYLINPKDQSTKTLCASTTNTQPRLTAAAQPSPATRSKP